MQNDNNQPIYIISPDSQRTTGRTAQKNNIMAAKLVAETVRTTLGPKGMDKMVVDSLGDVIITNDGVTILEEMQIEHPAAKMIVEVAKTQENEVGDGTTTAVVLAGELLKNAETLLEQNIHPTVIVKGYKLAAAKAINVLNNIAEKLDIKDKKTLQKLASTAIIGKSAESSKELLSQIVVDAVLSIIDNETIDKDFIKIEKKSGGGIDDTTFIEGIVVDKEKVNSQMPSSIENPKILLLDSALEVKETEMDAKIQITDPNQMQAFLDMEENMIKRKVDKVIALGANVVMCQKGIDDLAQHFLAKQGIYAARRVKKSDMEKLAKATGAKIVTKLEDATSDSLGQAGLVKEQKVGDDEMTYVTGCKKAKAVTILVRGATEHVVDETKRALDDAIGDIISAIKGGKIVAGAGAPEMEIARNLRIFADTLSGREQLAVEAFAKSMEIIPITLAENAGLDPIDVITEMKAAHEKGQKWAGVDVFKGKVIDAWKEDILEPLQIKTQAVRSATEVATMILRIDDVIAGNPGNQPMPQGPSGMGGMGGMPGM